MGNNSCTVDANSYVYCLKKNFSLLSELSTSELNTLNSKRKSYYVKKGKSIFNIGEKAKGLICLSTGKAKILVEDELGNAQIVSLKKEVDFLGFHELMSNTKYSTSASAITDFLFVLLTKKIFILL